MRWSLLRRGPKAYNEGMTRDVARERLIWLGALLVPLLVCLAAVPLRQTIANTSVALVLVIVVVAVASLGRRWPGIVAAASAGVWFDFFLTQPYQRLTITSPDDVETLLLLLAVGVAVTEVAQWGRRQQAVAAKRQGYLQGLETIARAASAGTTSPSRLIEAACEQMTSVLDLDRCRFVYDSGLGRPRIEPDGRLRIGDKVRDVDTIGLPVEDETELVVENGGRFMGRFLMTPRPGSVTTRGERLVALALATQVGATLRAYADSHPSR